MQSMRCDLQKLLWRSDNVKSTALLASSNEPHMQREGHPVANRQEGPNEHSHVHHPQSPV